MTWINVPARCVATLATLLAAAATASAANSFSNSLKGFTGNSNQGATQTAVAAAGFNFSDAGVGTAVPPAADVYKVQFDSSGAHFGVGQVVNDGRNYMRTIQTDYANVSFTAEITVTTPDFDTQNAYFGLGSGNANNDFFRVPDFGTANASVMYWGENEIATPTVETFAINNASTISSGVLNPATGFGNGTYRVRMSYDWFQKKAQFSIDLNYAGGPFTADLTAPALNVLPLYAADGFPTEPGRIYFGGDLGATLSDFSVNVTSSPVVYGDLNNSGTITFADWMILRSNLYTDTTGTHSDMYFLGDLTADLVIDQADFAAFKTLYDGLNGSGAFLRMIASVPEPSAALVALSAVLAMLPFRRRTACHS